MTIPLGIRRISDTCGQNLVEFSVVAFLSVMVILGVFEMCRMALVYTTLANGARVGVRYATVHGTDSPPATSVQSVVNTYLQAATVNTTNASVSVNYPDATGGVTCKDPGCHVTVTVSYPYDPFTSYFPLSVNLWSTSQGVITF